MRPKAFQSTKGAPKASNQIKSLKPNEFQAGTRGEACSIQLVAYSLHNYSKCIQSKCFVNVTTPTHTHTHTHTQLCVGPNQTQPGGTARQVGSFQIGRTSAISGQRQEVLTSHLLIFVAVTRRDSLISVAPESRTRLWRAPVH